MGLLNKAKEITSNNEKISSDYEELNNELSDYQSELDLDNIDIIDENPKFVKNNMNSDITDITDQLEIIDENDEDIPDLGVDNDIDDFDESADFEINLTDDYENIVDDKIPVISENKSESEMIEPDSSDENDVSQIKNRIVESNKDMLLLFEVSKEIMRSSSADDLYDVVLFILMGQIGASVASIIIPLDNSDKWRLGLSRGTSLKSENITFKNSDFILKEVLKRKNVIEITEFKDNKNCHEEYLKFKSIDTHLICPVVYENEVKFIILLGEKITVGQYTSEERSFIKKIFEVSGIVAHKLIRTDILIEQNNDLKSHEEQLIHLDAYEQSLRLSGSEKEVNAIISNELKDFGIDCYAYYFMDSLNDRYYVKYNENEDYLGLKEKNYFINTDNAFTVYLSRNLEIKEIDNPVNSEILKSVFENSYLTKINTFSTFPYLIEGYLIGFLIIFRADIEKLNKSKVQVMRFSKNVFLNHFSKFGLRFKTLRLIDNYSHELKRMKDSIDEAKKMNIPVAFAMFGIKNLKRYQKEHGDLKSKKMMSSIGEKIRERISKSDFIVRKDYNKFLIALPGKNKKAALTFCNSLKNELISLTRESEFQFMITFINSIFPDDGDNVFDLMDLLK